MIPAITLTVFFFFFILQTSVLRMFSGAAPDVSLLAAIYFGLRWGRYPGMDVGVVAGLLQDVASHGMMGINLLSKGVVGLLCGWLKERHFVEWAAPITWALLILAGTIINGYIFQRYAQSFFNYQAGFLGALGGLILQSLLNMLFGLPLFSFLIWMETKLRGLLGIREI